MGARPNAPAGIPERDGDAPRASRIVESRSRDADIDQVWRARDAQDWPVRPATRIRGAEFIGMRLVMDGVTLRQASITDSSRIAGLLTQLGYPTTPAEMEDRLAVLLSHSDYATFVAETS